MIVQLLGKQNIVFCGHHECGSFSPDPASKQNKGNFKAIPNLLMAQGNFKIAPYVHQVPRNAFCLSWNMLKI